MDSNPTDHQLVMEEFKNNEILRFNCYKGQTHCVDLTMS